MIRARLFSALLVFAFAAPWSQAAAQQQPAGSLPLDPQVTIGELPNGLRYFIRENVWPAKRAELRLIVDVGSIVESEDQLGLAHFTEHMAFNGTRQFPKQELVQYLQSIGMRFGPDVNAYTGFDETVYMLQLPTDDGVFLERGIAILGDWAHAQTFDPDQIDAERGVVIEEWRLRRGAGSRMQDRQLPVLLAGSRYAERLPIGSVDVLRTFPHEALTRFYRDWYRPDMMAVIAVGDFDGAEVERMIRETFSPIPAPAEPTVRPVETVPDHDDTYVTVATDPEATNNSLTIYHLVPRRDHMTYAGYRDRTIEGLYFAMLNARFSEIAQKPDAPFVGAGMGRGYFVRTADAYTIGAGVKDGGIEAGLDAVLTEVERAARHGFTATELERARSNAITAMERTYAQREQRTSVSRASELVRHVVNGEDAAGTDAEYELQMGMLPHVTLEEINEIAGNRPPVRNRVIMVQAPEKDGVDVPDEARVLAVAEAVKQKDIAPYEDLVVDRPLLADLPEPGAIVGQSTVPGLDVTEWRLDNGVRVILKPTDFQTDQVMLRGFSPGGTSLVPDSLYIDAMLATSASSVGGLGEHSQQDLRKVLTGKTASAGAVIGPRTEGIAGSSTRTDIETMLELVYMRFLPPRRDADAFASFTQANQAMLANRAGSPQAAFSDTITVTMAQNHPRALPISAAIFDEVDLDRALAIYRDRFADASDFTFVIVGDFDVDSIRPAVQRYLGGLPSLNREEAGRDIGIRPPTGVVRKTVRAGAEEQSQTYISFTGPFDYSASERHLLMSMGEVLQNRLLEELREALGGTYSVNVSAGGGRDEPATYSATIVFGSAPERAEELADAVMAQITAMQDEGPTAAEVDKVREAQRRSRELVLKQNAYWLGSMAAAYEHGDDPRDILKQHELTEALTPSAIREVARRYLRMDNYVHITLLPAAPNM
ncbi:MAG: insulinase family protein [Gemmatimonadetes bacterium]|nr:insulinase family protein [Gemmatimonadota bacterium]